MNSNEIGNVMDELSEDSENEDESIDMKRKYYDNGDTKAAKKKRMEKPPTVEELNNLKETENLFNNNKFRFFIEELTQKIKINNKHKRNLTTWLDRFDVFIQKLKDHRIRLSSILNGEKHNSVKNGVRSKLATYEQLYSTDNDLELHLTKPEESKKFGLYYCNSLPAPNLTLNIALIMPKKCFHSKDFLNNRYLTKRYYYLAFIAEIMKETDLASEITIEYHEENHLLPVLNVIPSNCSKTTVKIYAVPCEEMFKPSRFVPDQNNVKMDLFNMNAGDNVKDIPTILYNSTLAHDVTLVSNNSYFEEMLAELEHVQEGIKLIYVWLKQRELNIGMGSFTDNLILYFIVYLMQKKKINKYMSSYQVIRNFWGFLSTNDLYKNPISLTNVSESVFESFKSNFDVICLDKTGFYNYAAFLNVEFYRKIQYECQKALDCIDSLNNTQPFLNLFLIKYPFYLQYDLIIDMSDALPLEKNENILFEKNSYIGYKDLSLVEYISKMLKRALNKRLVNMVPLLKYENRTLKKLFFGVNLNPNEAFSFIEKGPDLNDFAAVSEFSRFWGDLASNRRFKDGSVKVAVVFKTNTVRGKRNIIEKIVDFILKTKLGLQYRLFYNKFDEFVQHKQLGIPYPSGTNEEMTLKIIRASDDLENKLRKLDLPLNIVSVQGASDTFCFTDVFPPIPTNYEITHKMFTTEMNNIIFADLDYNKSVPRLVKSIDCVLQLEHSSKWPSDLKALQHLKTSFYLRISDLLTKEHKITCHIARDYLEIFYQGLVFRYRFYIPKEIGLVKKNIENGLTCYRDSEDSMEMEKSLKVLPKVISALKGLNSLHPSFGLGTCIMKRWLRSQMIDDYHMPDIVLNLLNASLYLNNEVSCSPAISFLRFLKFFVEFSWSIQTVIVNFNDDITKEEISSIEEKLLQNRDAYPKLYIIMSYDDGLSIFTRNSPTEEVLVRIQELANNSLQLIGEAIMNQRLIDFKKLFVPSTIGYDLIIHLNPLLNARKYEQINDQSSRLVLEKYQDSNDNNLIPIVNFDPIQQYLTELRNNFGKYALFFHDTYGGCKICVLFCTNITTEERDFKVQNVNAFKRNQDNSKLIFNMDAIIEDFYVLGNDMILHIEKP